MRRNKRILLVSHCILNQNTVIENEARAEGAILSATEWAMQKRDLELSDSPAPNLPILG